MVITHTPNLFEATGRLSQPVYDELKVINQPKDLCPFLTLYHFVCNNTDDDDDDDARPQRYSHSDDNDEISGGA